MGLEAPQSRSGSESVSESELRTTCLPLDTIRLLPPEFADVCDRTGGCVSGLESGGIVGAEAAIAGVEAESGEVFLVADGRESSAMGLAMMGGLLVASGVAVRVSLWL